MQLEWWCEGHQGMTSLDIHGRCSLCGSDALDHAARHDIEIWLLDKGKLNAVLSAAVVPEAP